MGVEWAMVQHGVPSDFDRNEREEEQVWKAQYEVGTQIQDTLGRAFQLHQKTDFLISKVNAFPCELSVSDPVCVCFAYVFPFAAAEGNLA